MQCCACLHHILSAAALPAYTSQLHGQQQSAAAMWLESTQRPMASVPVCAELYTKSCRDNTYLFVCACRTLLLGGATSGGPTAELPLHSACLSQGARPSILVCNSQGVSRQMRATTTSVGCEKLQVMTWCVWGVCGWRAWRDKRQLRSLDGFGW